MGNTDSMDMGICHSMDKDIYSHSNKSLLSFLHSLLVQKDLLVQQQHRVLVILFQRDRFLLPLPLPLLPQFSILQGLLLFLLFLTFFPLPLSFQYLYLIFLTVLLLQI
ncbi:MAG: hypothetical protein DRP01_01800 [Archaeoglobales archaeon]|nr:MAG: hypothetical protein DRP01_01800 [Archaeoglobales archaeon]